MRNCSNKAESLQAIHEWGFILYRIDAAANDCESQLFEGDDPAELMKIYVGHEGHNITVTRFPRFDDREWWENAQKMYTNNTNRT